MVAADEPLGAANRVLGYKKVTVNVTNVEETETVTLSARQAQVGTELTATYNDADNEKPTGTDITCGSGTWAVRRFPAPTRTSTYPPNKQWLASGRGQLHQDRWQQENSVSDDQCSGGAQCSRNVTNLRSRRGLTEEAWTRTHLRGPRVGSPVAATDPGDTLTYTWGPTNDGQLPHRPGYGPDHGRAPDTLDHETNPTDTVHVTATDPAGGTDGATTQDRGPSPSTT